MGSERINIVHFSVPTATFRTFENDVDFYIDFWGQKSPKLPQNGIQNGPKIIAPIDFSILGVQNAPQGLYIDPQASKISPKGLNTNPKSQFGLHFGAKFY